MMTCFKFLAAVLVFAGVLPFAAAEARRAPSPDELAGVKAGGVVTVLDGGAVVDDLRVSPDGRWVLATVFGDDIENNVIRLVAGDGSGRSILEAPRGYKNTPVFFTDTRLFVSLAGNKDLPDGIYAGQRSGTSVKWTLFEKGSFRDLAISDDGRFLAASAGRWNAATVRSVVRVWPLDFKGGKAGPSYAIAPELKSQVHKIAWGPDGRSLVFAAQVPRAGTAYGQSNLYSAENKPDAPARLLRERASHPSLGNGSGSPLLFFLESDEDGGSLVLYNPLTRNETIVARVDGLVPLSLEYDPAHDRLLLGVQGSAAVAGILSVPAR